MTDRAAASDPKIQRLDAFARDPDQLLDEPHSVWRMILRRFLSRKISIAGMILVGLMTTIAIFAPIIAPYDPYEVLIGKEDVSRFDKPCIHMLGCDPATPQHILGIDGNVRDQFSRIIYGARVSLTLGISTVTIAILIGATIGAVAGYTSGWIDNVLMRIMDVVLGFPGFLLAIAIVAALGPGLRNTLIALATVTIPQYARVMRASVLSVKEIDYVAASRALGASSARILLTRIAPNAITPLIVLGTLGIASAILEAAGLGFLGLGAQPPQAEWGTMLAANRNRVFSDPHLVFFPGLAIMITVLGFNLIGDGLRDAMDPTLND
ncbi:MAG TPA: ABC transporter permease [Acidimicrobiia bacterium]|nr:ABC transporter permease [Acidimicrobiia bacterium]